MTIKEFYEWAKEHNYEDLELEVAFSDDGGFYQGSRSFNSDEVEIINNSIII